MLPLYLPLVLIIGAVVCYEDLKFGLIKNKYIVALLLVFVFRFIISPLSFLNLSFLAYLLWVFFTGVFLYFIDLWPAGDAKLFIALSLFFPVEIMGTKTIFNFLINSFVPFFFGFIPIAIFRSETNKIKEAFRSSFNLYNFFLISSMYMGVVWILMLPLSLLGIPTNIFVIIIALFLVFEIFGRITRFNMEYVYVLLVILRVVLDYRTVFSLNFLKNLIIIVVVFIFFRFFILRLTFDISVKKVKIRNLKPGMEVAEGIKKTGEKRYAKIKLIQMSFYDFLAQRKEKFIHSKTLTREDVKNIKRLRRIGEIPFESILVHQSILFGIFLYIGYVITFLLRTDFIHALFI